MQIHMEKKKRNSYTCSINDSPWIKITIIIVFALISTLVSARKAFGNVKNKQFCVQEFSADSEFHELTQQGGKLGVS